MGHKGKQAAAIAAAIQCSADVWHHRKWNDWNDWNSWSDTAKVVANEKQLTIIQDAFRDALKANRREDATLLRNCDLAEARMNQRNAPTVFSEKVKACEQVDKDYERFTGIAVTHSHFRSRAISVQDAHKAVRRSCRQGLCSHVCCVVLATVPVAPRVFNLCLLGCQRHVA